MLGFVAVFIALGVVAAAARGGVAQLVECCPDAPSLRASGCKNGYQASQRHVGRALKPGYARDKDIVDAGNTIGVCEAVQP